MAETAGALPIPATDVFNNPTPDTYPNIAELSVGDERDKRRLVMVGTWHFTNPSGPHGWQFVPLREIVTHTIEPQSDAPWAALTEGNATERLRRLRPEMSFEEALAVEQEMGILILQAIRREQSVDSWDMLLGKEMGTFLDMYADPASALPDDFRRAWESSGQLAQWLYYHEYAKLSLQWLRRLEQRTTVGDRHDGYVKRRLNVQGVDTVVAKHRIDTSMKTLRSIHEEACREAGFDTPPLGPQTALEQGILSDTYYAVHFAAAGSPDDYFAGASKLQRVGSIASDIFRNRCLADAVMGRLFAPKPKNVALFAGGAHILPSLRIMQEKGVAMDTLRWHIGMEACKAYAMENQEAS